MWTFSRRILSQNRLFYRNFLVRNDAIVGWFNSKPCFTRGKQDNSKNDSVNVSRLFEPTAAKCSTDANLGIELTGSISKSDILKVLNEFCQKTVNRSLCFEHGLDGKYILILIKLNILLMSTLYYSVNRICSTEGVCKFSAILF